MLNNLCQEILFPSSTFKWTDALTSSEVFYDLSQLNSFHKVIKNLLPVEVSHDMSLSAHLDILSTTSVDNLLSVGSISDNRLSINEFIEIFNLVKNDKNIEFVISLAMHQIKTLDLLTNIEKKFGLEDNDFRYLLTIQSFQSMCTLGMDVVYIDHHILSTIKKYIWKNYLIEPEFCYSVLEKYISLNSLHTPILYNNFNFDDKQRQLTVLNNVKKSSAFNFENFSKNFYSNKNKNNKLPVWFNTLSHIFNSLINHKEDSFDFDSFDFVNISEGIAQVIYILQYIKDTQNKLKNTSTFPIKYSQFVEHNQYVNIIFLNHLMDGLIALSDKKNFQSFHATQWSALIHVLHDSIYNLNKINQTLDYYNPFYQKCDKFIQNLQLKFPDLIKNKEFNISRYSLIFHSLFKDLIVNEDIYIMQDNNLYLSPVLFETPYSFESHILNILNGYPLDLSFSHSSLIHKNIEFDIFCNSAIAHRLNIHDEQTTPINKHIPLHFQQCNHNIFETLNSDKFKFLNSLSKFDELYLLYEFGIDSIKQEISKEIKNLIDFFTTPLKTQGKFSLHDFYQFNLSQDKELIETTVFKQLFFKDSSIGLPSYIPLFFDSKKQPVFFEFIDEHNIKPIFNEFQYLLNLYHDSTEGINMFNNNRHWFADKALLFDNYCIFIEFIADGNYESSFKEEIISFNKNVMDKIIHFSLYDSEDINVEQIFHILNLKLSLTHTNSKEPIKARTKI